MLGTIRRWMGIGAQRQKVETASRGSLRARYDAAQTTDDNSRHWAAADLLSPASANSPEVRRLLRSRSRYEVANNSYAKGIVLTLANDRIGSGPRLQLYSPDTIANQEFETAWAQWAKEIKLSAKLRTLSHAYDGDGEGTGQLIYNPRLRGRIKLDLRLFECDRMASPFDRSLPPEGQLHDGIEFDDAGNPTHYWVHDRHPGEWLWSKAGAKKISAEQIIHWFRCDRPGQTRGVPTLTPALPLFAELRRYTLAVIAAAETAADHAFILKTTGPAAQVADVEAFARLEIERRMGVVAPEGWEPSQLRAEQPTTTYPEFKKEIINEISRCLNMPFNIAAGNSSSYNYSSGRLDHQVYHREIGICRDSCEDEALWKLLVAFAEEYRLLGGRMPPGEIIEWGVDWLWPGFGHVDPTKESTAQGQRLANLTTTLEREWAGQGEDVYRQIPRMGREHRALIAEGLPSPYGAQPGAPAAPASNDPAPSDDPTPDDDADPDNVEPDNAQDE